MSSLRFLFCRGFFWLVFFVLFFAFFWSIWRRPALEPGFSLESSESLFQEGSSSVPQRIVQTLWVCLHSSQLQLGVQSGIFIMLPWHGTTALLHFYSFKSVLFSWCCSIPSCWHPWAHVIQPRRYFQGHLVSFPKLHSPNCKTSVLSPGTAVLS